MDWKAWMQFLCSVMDWMLHSVMDWMLRSVMDWVLLLVEKVWIKGRDSSFEQDDSKIQLRRLHPSRKQCCWSRLQRGPHQIQNHILGIPLLVSIF
jgi:hypothetical protein